MKSSACCRRDGDDCQYRIKSSTEAFERVAKESQLALS